ncbi:MULTISPECIES: phosphoadenosine phosphosulfate reductase family protein [Achromobacter]|uniref:phosphoadenosine phosphosulfate reductase domain-containing protein n=1 Tax=Achromobacter TaxID=222 RepID=UPI0023F988FB|nr:phosphoadenosine phosphosulfate reductase family protein [Achromobacter anxifer]MDF8363349.1 phosphoadenosine phosphosulfate reductase family protein [Achromobacter anxifer]
MIDVRITTEIQSLIDRGAVFVTNHSGGKDSQAMFIALSRIIPAAQLVVVHADLGEVEWHGALEHIHATIGQVPLRVCRSRRSLLQMIVDRGKFPSPQQRQCTSDLKRGPIEREIRRMKVPLIVNCMGMRAQESPRRAKLATFKYSNRNSKAGREWYDWLPIHDATVEQVFATIASAGQSPHWAYAAGMSRFSCCFCIMSSKDDLRNAARLNPRLYSTYVELERQTGTVMMMPTKKGGKLTLEQITGIPATAVPLPWPTRSDSVPTNEAAH